MDHDAFRRVECDPGGLGNAVSDTDEGELERTLLDPLERVGRAQVCFDAHLFDP